MSTSYSVIQGDTFEIVSRRVYGVGGEGLRIKGANPGSVEPLTAGQVLVIPTLPGTPEDSPQMGVSASVNEAAIFVDNKRFRFWTGVRLIRALDTIDSIEFTAPFDADNKAQRDAFRPFSYKPTRFTVDGETLFTGTMLGPLPELEPNSKTMSVGGYSTPGVLGTCTLPAGIYPANEFNGETLEGIAKSVAGHFGINVVFEAPAGAAFDREACAADKKVMTFLADLARQRNLVIGNNQKGELVFRQSAPAGVPVAVLEQGASPVQSVSAFYNHDQYYSHITGIEPVVVGATGSQYTVKNPQLASVIRPFTFQVPDAIGGDMQPATEAKAGRMFGNMASYTVTVNTWRDAKGKLWLPNTTVQLLAPSAMVYTAYKFIIRSVIMERTAQHEQATLDLVIPGSFAGVLPEVLPWDA